MPSGFIGNAVEKYLEAVDFALETAIVVHNKDPFEHLVNNQIQPHPIIHHRDNEQTPHPLETAKTGDFSTGLGTSGNIVVDEESYIDIQNSIKETDRIVSGKFYAVLNQIKDLSNRSFQLPHTLPRIMSILNEVDNSYSRYISPTDDIVNLTRTYSSQITNL